MSSWHGVLAVVLAGCASAGEPGTGAIDARLPTGDGSPGTARQCASGELAIEISTTGEVTCAPIETLVRDAIANSCAVYLGWRDDCNGCTTPPAKWGRAGATCMNGVGADSTCTMPSLGGATLPMFGLNFDGDVDGNDKLYGSLHCTTRAPTASVTPCAAGAFVTGKYGSSWTCTSLDAAVIEYVRASCVLYMGWQDDCNGCTTAPGKWGRAGDGRCMNGVGADNTCTVADLGGESLNLFGLNPDGDVDGNDKLHVGLHCTAPAPATTTATADCPAGQFVSATAADGSFTCTSPAPAVAQYFTQRCALYFGWRDSCNGCTTPPLKWGLARAGGCMLGAGTNNTCGTFTLGDSVDLFGLDTDGDVDGNDTLYVGLRCE